MERQVDRPTASGVATTAEKNDLSEKLAKISMNLRPFQALDYDPAQGVLVLISEWQIPSDDGERIAAIVAQRRGDERITVRRYDEHYKVALIKRLNV